MKHLVQKRKKKSTSQCPPRGNAPALAEATLASAAAVADAATEESLLDLEGIEGAICDFAAGEPPPEMRDGIARA